MIAEKLMRIQTEIKAPKNLYNSFGKYKYRNAEGICEAVKPFLVKEKCSLTLEDEIIEVGGRIYVKAIAKIIDIETGESVKVAAFARESLEKKGMDDSQITGTASSYARKYALNGLFLLDDTKDADTDEYKMQTEEKQEPKNEELATENQRNLIKMLCNEKGIVYESALQKCKLTDATLTKAMASRIIKQLQERE